MDNYYKSLVNMSQPRLIEKNVEDNQPKKVSWKEDTERIRQLDLQNLRRDVISNGYENFIRTQIIPSLGVISSYELDVVFYDDLEERISCKLPYKSDYIAILKIPDARSYLSSLKKIINKEVAVISTDTLCWGEGDIVYRDSYDSGQLHTELMDSRAEQPAAIDHVVLPEWLDELIFKKLHAIYQPSFERYSYNLDLDTKESRIYLGTYFPRSFAETYLVFHSLFRDRAVLKTICSKSTINVLDFGCGTGGEIFGLLQSLEEYTSKRLNFRIIAMDGNHNSLRLFEEISRNYNLRGRNFIKSKIFPCVINSCSDVKDVLSIVRDKFDFIITSKAIGEFQRKGIFTPNGYEFFLNSFSPLLAKSGVMLILDVTIKDSKSGLYLPQTLNLGTNSFLSRHHPEFKSIAPCQGHINGQFCKRACYFKTVVQVSHSLKKKDRSSFSLRVIVREGMQLDPSVFKTQFTSPCLHG